MKQKPIKKKKVLAVETSCDDTSVAIVREDGLVICNKVANQDSLHQAYGGVVPELASRNHADTLLPLIKRLLKESDFDFKDLDLLAVTNRPGLVGSLIVGLVTVKSLSLLLKKPYVAVNHIEGHILSVFLWEKNQKKIPFKFPFLALIVSGGHTSLFEVRGFGEYFLIAKTLDDAVGEVLDKVARLLGLKYPGGAEMDKISKGLKAGSYSFPKVKLKRDNINFSFSGLKTYAFKLIQEKKLSESKKLIPYFCADFQEAVTDQLIERLDYFSKKKHFKSLVIAGGVSANSRLRLKAKDFAEKNKIKLILPALKYCTDNAAMIGFAGVKLFQRGLRSPQNLNCYPYSLPEDFSSVFFNPAK